MSRFHPLIGVSEAVTLLLVALGAKIFLTYTPFIYDSAMTAAWIIPLLHTAIGTAGILLLVSLLQKYPGRDLVQIGEELVGPYLNLMFGLFYLVVFVAGAGIALRASAERMLIGFLPDTPISMVVLLFMAGGLVVSYLGLEAVARSARFLIIILVLTMLGLYLLTVLFWDYDTVFPLLGAGPVEVAKGALMYSGAFTEILLLGLIYPFIPADRVKTVAVAGVLVTGLFMLISIIVPLLVFSYPTVSELTLPSFDLARIISIGRFGQRMEVVFLPIWVFGILGLLALFTYSSAIVLARLCKLSDYRPFILAVTVFIVAVAFVPQNTPEVIYFVQHYQSRYSFGLLMAVLLLLWVVARFKGGREAKNE